MRDPLQISSNNEISTKRISNSGGNSRRYGTGHRSVSPATTGKVSTRSSTRKPIVYKSIRNRNARNLTNGAFNFHSTHRSQTAVTMDNSTRANTNTNNTLILSESQRLLNSDRKQSGQHKRSVIAENQLQWSRTSIDPPLYRHKSSVTSPIASKSDYLQYSGRKYHQLRSERHRAFQE